VEKLSASVRELFSSHKKAKSDYYFQVCPSVIGMELPPPPKGQLSLSLMFGFFRLSVEKIQVPLKSDKVTDILLKVLSIFMIIYHMDYQNKHFFPKIASFMRYSGEILYSQAGHR
jgi:hypothetical protein